jgi:hypothetical protein
LRLFSRELGEENRHERHATQRRTDHRHFEARGSRVEHGGVVPSPADHGADLLYYRWKAKYGGMDSEDAKKLKQLEEENRKLKHVVADLTLDNRALKDVLSRNF